MSTQATTASTSFVELSPIPGRGESGPLEVYLREQYRRGTMHRPARDRAKSWLTSAVVPVEIRKARRLAETGAPLKLHLGCADNYLDGWVNIDLVRPGRRLDLRWDLRRGLPFPTGTVDTIFSEHLFEHLPLLGTLSLLKECRRVMTKGGVIRIGVPDLERYVRAYLGQDSIIDEVRSGRPTPAIALNEIYYFHGHRTMYDLETLALLLHEAGFGLVTRSTFGAGIINPPPDSEHRRRETLYVEAVVG